MSHYLLAPFGSAGDVNPFIWLGRMLRSRGHDVTIIGISLFRETVEREKFDFVGIGHDHEFDAVIKHPDLWKPVKASALVFGLAAKLMRPYYAEIVSRIVPGHTVIVAPLSVLAARAARERFRVPLVNVHLQPAALLSVHDETIFLPGAEWMAKLPSWMRRLMFVLPNPADIAARKDVQAFCKKIGIPAPRKVMPDWLFSPDANLALFPEWFAMRQPDWPRNTNAAGFPLEDLQDQFAMPPEIEAFLAEGDKPVLLTAGTGNAQAGKFFQTAVEACHQAGRRMLIGTRFREQLPASLPAGARVFDYLPFSAVLSRCAAIVHHGGIGTVSQALAAGVPQLVMPLAHDQPDNALRVKRLHAGDYLTPRQFTVGNVTNALKRIISDPQVGVANAEWKRLCAEADAGTQAIRTLESVLPSAGLPAAA